MIIINGLEKPTVFSVFIDGLRTHHRYGGFLGDPMDQQTPEQLVFGLVKQLADAKDALRQIGEKAGAYGNAMGPEEGFPF